MPMVRSDDIPMSGWLPTRDGLWHVAAVSVVVFVGYLAVAVSELAFSPTRSSSNSEYIPSEMEYALTVLNALAGAEIYALFGSAPILLLVLRTQIWPRIPAALVSAGVITGVFSAIGVYASAIERSYREHAWVAEARAEGHSPEPLDLSISMYFNEIWSGFWEGFVAALVIGITIWVPLYLGILFCERYTEIEITRSAPR